MANMTGPHTDTGYLKTGRTEILKNSYNTNAKESGKIYNPEGCGVNVRYYGWEAALRGYNGWGCYDVNSPKYVDSVRNIYIRLEKFAK